jgi:hypothetical protein
MQGRLLSPAMHRLDANARSFWSGADIAGVRGRAFGHSG